MPARTRHRRTDDAEDLSSQILSEPASPQHDHVEVMADEEMDDEMAEDEDDEVEEVGGNDHSTPTCVSLERPIDDHHQTKSRKHFHHLVSKRSHHWLPGL